MARLRQPERSRLGEGESWRTLLRATGQGDAGLSFGDASLPESCKRRRLEFGEDDGPGRRRLDACCALEPAKRLEVRGLAAPRGRRSSPRRRVESEWRWAVRSRWSWCSE